MDRFIRLSDDERRRYFVQTAERMRLSPQIIEKDFWVCWTLRELFALPNIREYAHCAPIAGNVRRSGEG